MAEANLTSVIEAYLERQGGTVVERLVKACKEQYSEDAPELENDETLKAFVATKPDLFKVVTSVNNVERIKLVNPPKRERKKPNGALLSLVMKLLTDQGAVDEEHAVPLTDLYNSAVETSKQTEEGAEPAAEPSADLASEDDFVQIFRQGRGRRVMLQNKTVWLPAPAPSTRREGGGADGEGAPRNTRAAPRPVGVPREVNIADDANDSTLIGKFVYEQLKTRSALASESGLSVKILLRSVSQSFLELRPDSPPASMNSLRIFKLFLAGIEGIKRERPQRRTAPRPATNGGSKRPPPPLDPVVWIEDEDVIVAAIEGGLPEDLANTDVKPDVIDDTVAESGEAVAHKVLEQDAWNTSVIGPTSNPDVLAKFLSDNSDQQIWGFETEHRVGLGRRTAGGIAMIIISNMEHTFLWDVHTGGMPDCLKAWLADETFYKGGVKVAPKASKLASQFDIEPKKFVELSKLAQDLGEINEAGKAGMRVITKNVLKCAVQRPPAVRDSNWELRPLSKRQYLYAIEDGYVSALLFVHMTARLHNADKGHLLAEACITLDE